MKSFNLILLVLASIIFTSCEPDPDVSRARILSGEWYGDFGMYYTYHYRDGKEITFDCYETDLTFYSDYEYSSHGDGVEIDYYEDGPYIYQRYTFDWEIIDRRIFLYYHYDSELDVEIYDYSLSDDYFSGYFKGSETHFRLRRINQFYYDEDFYYMSYDYSCTHRDNWSYRYLNNNKSLNIESAETNNVGTDDGYIIRRGNRYQ